MRAMMWGALLLSATFAVTPASAAWLEAKSRHFIVYSQGSPASVRKFATDLERFDQGTRKVLGYGDVEGVEPNPLTVFVVDDIGDINSLCKGGSEIAKNCQSVAGFYTTKVSGSVAFVPRYAGPDGLDPRQILFHEYAHHLMLANTGGAYPSWYSEGFAELVSQVKLDSDGAIGIGLPAKGRAGSLFYSTAIPVRELLTLKPGGMSREKGSSFYARSWLLTHFLTFSNERQGQLVKYLTAINAGVPASEAASSTFGDLTKLNNELDNYLQRGRFQYMQVKVAPIAPESVILRPLNAGEAAMMQVRMQSTRGIADTDASALAAEARRIAAGYPDDVGAQVALAEAEFDAGALDAAEAAVDRALSKDPNDMKAMIFKGQILMRRASDAGREDDATWKAIRRWYLKANKIEPNAAWPLMLFYQSFGEQRARATPNAVDALVRAMLLVPQDDGLRMMVVRQLLSDDRLAEARIALMPLAFDPHLADGHPAAKLLAEIDQRIKDGEKSGKSLASEAIH